MRSVVLAQLRHHPARYVATALAIVLGTAFVALGFLFTSTLRNTLGDALVARAADADLVVGSASSEDDPVGVSDEQARAVAGTPGIAAASVLRSWYADAELPRLGRQGVQVDTVAANPRLRSQRLVSGSYPSGPGQVAIGSELADATGLAVGSTLPLAFESDAGDGADGGSGQQPTATGYRVTGVLSTRGDLEALGAGLQAFLPDSTTVPGGSVSQVTVLAGPRQDVSSLRREIQGRVGGATSGQPPVRTHAAYRADAVRGISLAVDLVGGFVLAFAILALAVAALVIANTFVILLTQRTRELALLRCVGAVRQQVFRSVVAEAAVLGLVASAVGVAVAEGVAAAAVAVANTFDLPLTIAVPTLDTRAVVVPVLAGVVVTVLAALAPARRATRVAPVAALRQDLGLAVRNRKGVFRLVLGLLLIAVGGLLLVAGLAAHGTNGVLMVSGGGALTFLGLIAAARLYVPAVARLVGLLVRPLGGIPARLGVLNVLRNPQRATATCTALVIGVTLVATVAVGAATARASALSLVLGDNPVDVTANAGGFPYLAPPSDGGQPGTPTRLPAGSEQRVRDVAGISAVVPLSQAAVTVVLPRRAKVVGAVFGVDPAALRRVAREDVTADLGPGTIAFGDNAYLPDAGDGAPGLRDGDRVTVTGAAGTRSLVAHRVAGLPTTALVDTGTLRAIAGDAPVTQVWARASALDAGGDIDRVDDTVNAVRTAVGNQPASAFGSTPDVVDVSGSANEAAALVTVLDGLVKILTALLAMALVIALVGIANTLSLSVLERRRENGLLRALGLSRAAMRVSIVWEAVTLAVVAVALGLGLGLFYAWAGTRAVFTGSTDGVVDTVFTVPVGQTLQLVGVAVAAALLASVLPARRAARTAPAQVLAAD